MKNKVYKLWESLHSEKQLGLVKRLYSVESKVNVYCIYQYPEEYYGIALSFPKSINFNLTPFALVSEPVIEIYEDSSFKDCMLLCAKIKSEKINEFSYLCENVIQAVLAEKNIAGAVKIFGNTLLRWKSLFESIQGIGLSKEEQQGLYGELHFLKKCLTYTSGAYYNIVENYVGTNGALIDFQGKDWAVEVKTTSMNNPQTLIINGERQLDDTMVDVLYLYHCSVAVSMHKGETLPDMVHCIREILKKDVAALFLFNAKLFEAAYLDIHESFYKERHYQLRKDSFFHVYDNFPRIRECELRDGVGNTRYSISIASLEAYRVTEQQVIFKCISND